MCGGRISSSEMHIQEEDHAPSKASFGLFEAKNRNDEKFLIQHMANVASVLEKSSKGLIKIAIMRHVERYLICVFTVWTGPSHLSPCLPEAATFTRGTGMTNGVKTVDSGWFELGCRELKKGGKCASISLGDIVSLRRIPTARADSDMVAYSCLAVLKAYFTRLKGVQSYSFYAAMDGRQTVGLGVWESIEAASFLADEQARGCNPGMSFWKALGTKHISFDIFQAVYVTHEPPISPDGKSGFRF